MTSTTMMMLKTIPNVHPAITIAIMVEEDPPLSVCVSIDGLTVAVVDTNDEPVVLVTGQKLLLLVCVTVYGCTTAVDDEPVAYTLVTGQELLLLVCVTVCGCTTVVVATTTTDPAVVNNEADNTGTVLETSKISVNAK